MYAVLLATLAQVPNPSVAQVRELLAGENEAKAIERTVALGKNALPAVAALAAEPARRQRALLAAAKLVLAKRLLDARWDGNQLLLTFPARQPGNILGGAGRAGAAVAGGDLPPPPAGLGFGPQLVGASITVFQAELGSTALWREQLGTRRKRQAEINDAQHRLHRQCRPFKSQYVCPPAAQDQLDRLEKEEVALKWLKIPTHLLPDGTGLANTTPPELDIFGRSLPPSGSRGEVEEVLEVVGSPL
jgi:hypothetical protein